MKSQDLRSSLQRDRLSRFDMREGGTFLTGYQFSVGISQCEYQRVTGTVLVIIFHSNNLAV